MDIRYRIIGIKLIGALLFLLIFLSVNYSHTLAAGLGNAFDNKTGSPLNTVAGKSGAGFNTTATFESIIGRVITMVLELLGAIFLILAIYGGYNWMTARGNEDMVEKAKKTITNAIIGLIIVLAAYAISRFIISVVSGAALAK